MRRNDGLLAVFGEPGDLSRGSACYFLRTCANVRLRHLSPNLAFHADCWVETGANKKSHERAQIFDPLALRAHTPSLRRTINSLVGELSF